MQRLEALLEVEALAVDVAVAAERVMYMAPGRSPTGVEVKARIGEIDSMTAVAFGRTILGRRSGMAVPPHRAKIGPEVIEVAQQLQTGRMSRLVARQKLSSALLPAQAGLQVLVAIAQRRAVAACQRRMESLGVVAVSS
jgi:hypothetical protein